MPSQQSLDELMQTLRRWFGDDITQEALCQAVQCAAVNFNGYAVAVARALRAQGYHDGRSRNKGSWVEAIARDPIDAQAARQGWWGTSPSPENLLIRAEEEMEANRAMAERLAHIPPWQREIYAAVVAGADVSAAKRRVMQPVYMRAYKARQKAAAAAASS